MWCETDGFLTTRYLVKKGGKEISYGYIVQDSCEVAGNLRQLGNNGPCIQQRGGLLGNDCTFTEWLANLYYNGLHAHWLVSKLMASKVDVLTVNILLFSP